MRQVTRGTLGTTYAPLLALLLGACDAGAPGADAPADSIGAIDSTAAAVPTSSSSGCARLPEALLERAVGFDVVMNDNSTGNCIATPASGAPADPTVDFRIEPRTAAYDYFSAQPDAEPVADLGDRAVWATLNETTGYVVAVRGGGSIIVGVARVDGIDAESRRIAEAVARTLIDSDRP